MKVVRYAAFLFLLCLSSFMNGQDQHFSQYFNQPMYLNPAMTGLFGGDQQLSLIYRNQWTQVTRQPYQHSGLAYDVKFGGGWAGGIQLLNQYAGSDGYSKTTALVNGSFNILKANPKAYHLIAGVQVGFIQQSFDPEKVTLASQYLPDIGYDPSNPTMENFNRTSQLDLDATVGLTFFTGNGQRKVNYFLGGAISHLTMPRINFFDDQARLPLKYVLHGGLRWLVGKNIILNPIGLLYYQGNSFDDQYGLNCQFAVPSSRTSLIVGASYRQDDAIIPMLGIRYSDLTLVMSYDVNVSNLRSMSETSPGAFELSAIYLFDKKEYDPKFVCPRL